jgi:heptosyltransferase-2
MSFENILIIQTAFPGDLILTTPLIRAAKERYPQAKITALVIPETAELLNNNPFLDEVILYDKRNKKGPGIAAILKNLRSERFDPALIPHRSFRSALLAKLAGCKRRVGFDTSAGKMFLTDKITYQIGKHEIERNLSLLTFDGEQPDIILPELYPGEKECAAVENFMRQSGITPSEEIVCLAPGSVWATKRWLPERFAELAELLIKNEKVKVILIGGNDDFQLAEKIISLTSAKPVNACGKLSLLESAALISRASLVISNDSAPTHMAVARRVPVIAIFGSTVPEFGFYPYGEENTVIRKFVYCQPCGIHGRRRCPEGHFRCMTEILTAEVYQGAKKKLNEARVKTS